MSIFDKKEPGDIEVPEIEVRGDEAKIPSDDDREQDQRVRLPKTKWF